MMSDIFKKSQSTSQILPFVAPVESLHGLCYFLYFSMFGKFHNLKRKKKASHIVVCSVSCLYTKCLLYLHIFIHLE